MRIALVALAAWLVGILTGLGYVALSGGAYEYQLLPSPANALRAAMEQDRCEPRSAGQLPYLLCPRFRLP